MVRKAKNKRSRLQIFSTLLLMVMIAAFIYKFTIVLENHQIFKMQYDDKTPLNSITPNSSDDRTASASQSKIEPNLSACVPFDKLNSPNAILIRLEDNTVLKEKKSEEKIYPASLTKIMTAIVAIEELPDLKEEVKLTNTTFEGLYEADASMAGFKVGERVSALDLLYGALLPSGAESCIGLADQIAGSEQEFVKLMNHKADDLDMKNTHFENVTGLHDKNHYTTVKDLANLLSYALKNDTFREIFTSPHHTTEPTNMHPDGITFYSNMFEKLNNQNITDGEILGGKTGYTDEAGLCLASLAKVGKQEYILISAGAKGDHNTKQYNIIDALAVYNSIGN